MALLCGTTHSKDVSRAGCTQRGRLSQAVKSACPTGTPLGAAWRRCTVLQEVPAHYRHNHQVIWVDVGAATWRLFSLSKPRLSTQRQQHQRQARRRYGCLLFRSFGFLLLFVPGQLLCGRCRSSCLPLHAVCCWCSRRCSLLALRAVVQTWQPASSAASCALNP